MNKLIALLVFLVSALTYGQDPLLQKDDPEMEKVAYEITKEYNNELALDGDQIILFEKKIEEFLIRRKIIESNYSGTKKLNALLNLQTQETIEMRDILTRPQMTIYKQIKSNIQPLAVVE